MNKKINAVAIKYFRMHTYLDMKNREIIHHTRYENKIPGIAT